MRSGIATGRCRTRSRRVRSAGPVAAWDRSPRSGSGWERAVHGREHLDDLARAHARFSYRIALSQPEANEHPEHGRVTDLLRARARPDELYYLAGNGAMIADAEDI